MNLENIFAYRLSSLLKERKVSKQALADAVNVSRPAISKLASGVNSPSIETLAAIAEYFNVSTDYLLGKTNDPHGLSSELKKPKDLLKVLEQEDFFLNGQILGSMDKERLLRLIEAMFWDAKEKSKHKEMD